MKLIVQALIGLFLISPIVLANSGLTLDAKNANLTQTTLFEDLGYKSGPLSDLTLLINDSFVESEALINLHVVRNPGYGMGNWRIETYCNGALVSRDTSTSEGDAVVTFKLPTGCLEKGENRIYFWSGGWEVMLLKDSNITIAQKEPSMEPTLKDFGFKTNSKNSSSMEFNDAVGNEKGKLKLHYVTLTPGGGYNYGNWNLVVKLNNVTIGNFNGLTTGENWLEVAIPSGITNKGANTLTFKPYDWPVLILEDSKLAIGENGNG
jgi:hypothetical protein